MTVGELIAKLRTVPPNYIVVALDVCRNHDEPVLNRGRMDVDDCDEDFFVPSADSDSCGFVAISVPGILPPDDSRL